MLEIHRSDSSDTLWKEVVLPWLGLHRPGFDSLDSKKLIIVPTGSLIFDLKRRLLKSCKGILGLRFMTHQQCRETLIKAKNLPVHVVAKEVLELLLSLAASKEQSPFYNSVQNDPTLFANTILSCAFANIHLSLYEEITNSKTRVTARLQDFLGKANLQIPGLIDWHLLLAANDQQKIFDHTLFWGFDANHWPLLPLLQAIVLHSRRAVFLALNGWVESTDAEALWQSTWEAFANKFRTTWQEHASSGEATNNEHILVCVDDKHQASLIVDKTIQLFVKDPQADVLISLPGRGIIHTEIISQFKELSVPLLDLIGQPGLASDVQIISAWVELQENWDVISFVHLVECCPEISLAYGFNNPKEIINTITKYVQELLTTDFDVIQNAILKEKPSSFCLVKISDYTTLEDFLQSFEELLGISRVKLNNSRVREIFKQIEVFHNELFPKVALLQFILKVCRHAQQRDIPSQRELCSRVVISNIDVAPWLSKKHLFVAGQNHHHWPPRHRAKSLLEPEWIHRLNVSFKILSPSGLGEECIKPSHTLLLSPDIAEQIAIRNTRISANNVSATTWVSYSTVEIQNNRPALPSSYLTSILKEKQMSPENPTPTSVPLITGIFNNKRTSRTAETNTSSSSPTNIHQSIVAHFRRRDRNTPFSKFDFTLTSDEHFRRAIPVKKLAEAVLQPAHLWFTAILGTKPSVDIQEPPHLSLFIGNKLHQILSVCVSSRKEKELRFNDTAVSEAQSLLSKVQKQLYLLDEKLIELVTSNSTQSTVLPCQLQFALNKLKQKTLAVAERLQSLLEQYAIQSEVAFHEVTTEEGLLLNAQIDAILTPTSNVFPCIILDYKSGDSSKANKTSDYLQLYLYQQILSANGIVAEARTLTPDGDDIQLSQSGLPNKLATIYSTFRLLYHRRSFPLLSPKKNPYTQSPRSPIALLEIPSSILRKKLGYWIPQDKTRTEFTEQVADQE